MKRRIIRIKGRTTNPSAPWAGSSTIAAAARTKPPPMQEMMQAMDAGVGQILDDAQRLRPGERHLRVFLLGQRSDHSWQQWKAPGHKGQMWEGGHRVPGIAWWPGKISPGTSKETIICLDVMPTLLALADATVPAGHHLDGINLLPHFLEGKTFARTHAVLGNGRAVGGSAGRLETGRQSRQSRGKTNSTALYNLAEDLEEQHDLSKTDTQTADELMQALKNWRKDVKTGATRQPNAPPAEASRQ